MGKNPTPNSISELGREYQKIKSVVSGDTKFMAIAIFYLAKEMDELNRSMKRLSKGHKRREPSKYNLFIAEKTAEGMTFKEAIAEYKKTKKD